MKIMTVKYYDGDVNYTITGLPKSMYEQQVAHKLSKNNVDIFYHLSKFVFVT